MRLLVVGILLICLGALTSAGLYRQYAHVDQVLRVTRTIPRGATVTAADLGVVSLPSTPGVATVPARDLQRIVGQEALTDLPAGTLLASGHVGSPAVAHGTVHVGLKLGPGRAPARAVPVGADVTLIAVPAANDRNASAVPEVSYHATVVTPVTSLPDGTQVIDVAVAGPDAARVTRLAATDSLALVREGAR